MTPLALLGEAFSALARHPLRAGLTGLGIVIGTASVIAMLGIGAGARTEVARTYAGIGANVIVVVPGASVIGGANGGAGSQPTLSFADARALAGDVP